MILIASAFSVSAQVDNVYVYGTVKDYNTSKKLDGIVVTVFKDGVKSNSVVTSANGKYEFNLDYGYVYKIVYEKAGIVAKNVSIDTKGIPETDRAGGLAMNVEMTLFQDIPGIDYSILNQPIGKSKYDEKAGMLSWDLAYTEQMRAELNRLQKEYDEKKKKEAGAEAACQKLMDQGNAAMGTKDFKKAVQAFTDALGLKPGDAMATARLSDAQIRLGEQDQAAQTEKRYADLIKEADGLFTKKSYEEARAKYASAAEVKEKEAYPKQRMKECDAFIADLAAKAEAERKAKELNDKYNAAVAAGDAAFKANKLDEAKAKFNEAAGLKPDEKYPPQQLAAIAAKEAELAKKAEEEKKAAELEAAYQAAVKAGDAAFNKTNYDEARAKYNEALGLKPKEKYPADQLAAIDKKLAEQAKKAEEEKKAAELEAAYQAAVKAGDAAFTGAHYDEARAKYNEALGLKPKEKYPTDQLAAIDKKLADLAKKAEEEKKAAELEAAYQAAVAAGDAAFRQEDYDGAKKSYNEALGLKPKEKYPADQLAQIAKALADKAKKAEEDRLAAERDAKYQGFMDKGEELFGKTKYAEAKAQFQEAQKVKPGEARPKERIVEIDALMDQLAREAEAKRKQEELEARYTALIASADKKFSSKKHAEALNDYKDASVLKPDEKYPKDQIAAINELLDASAREAAEKERMAREQAEKDRQYDAFIAQADKDFKAKSYEAATRGYTSALEVKPGEKHPADRLAEIRALLDAQAAADRDKAEKDAAEKARLEAEARKKAEEDSLRAAREAEERARRNAERQSAADEQARYDDAILRADAAFRNKAWDMAREGYNDALAIKAGEKYPKDQLAAIEQAIADLRKAERDAAAKAEADRLAAEERRRREAADAEAANMALEQARREREARRALDERYTKTILDADNAMGDKDYTYARELYAQALDIKPGESYPQAKMEQIDKLLAELDNQRRARELAAQKAAEKPAPVASTSNMDNRKEQEAEEFMREAREREEAEKYQRIRRQKTEIEQQHGDLAEKADTRHQEADRRNADYVAGMGQLYQGSEAMRMRNAEEVAAMKEERERREQELRERGLETTGKAKARAEDLETDTRQRQTSLADGRDTRSQVVYERQDDWRNRMEQIANAAKERTEAAREKAMEDAERNGRLQQEKGTLADRHREQVDMQRQKQEAKQKQLVAAAKDREQGQQEKLANISPNQQRAYSDYSRSELAAQYPQGVTEESYTEGNKVIIRRVLVQGNKADEYSKVIAKWGTFYFKNGQSISEYIWTVNTEQ
ncbi:MAG TPA: hypothetical protein PKD45_02385 [Flavobacteriales bacterium]|nr:hypothetical protein [Flavobacteriales bacterium]